MSIYSNLTNFNKVGIGQNETHGNLHPGKTSETFKKNIEKAVDRTFLYWLTSMESWPEMLQSTQRN